MRSQILSLLFWGVLSLLSGTMESAQAQNRAVDQGRFQKGNMGRPPNQDSVRVPNLNMHKPTYGGSACAQGTVSSVISPDGREVSVLFDAFTVRAGGAAGPRAAVGSCRVNIPFQVPAGYSVQIVKVDYRGFNALPAGATAKVSTTFGFGRWRHGARDPRAHLARWSEFVGPLSEDFMLSSMIRGPTFSPCGQPFILTAESTIHVTSNAQNQDSFTQIDSLDASSTPLKLALRWQKCQPDPGGGGDGGGTGEDGVVVPDPVRPPRPPPAVGGNCPAATVQLNAAQQGMALATAALMQVVNTCGGNMFCVVQVQTMYNQAQTNLTAAQTRHSQSCR